MKIHSQSDLLDFFHIVLLISVAQLLLEVDHCIASSGSWFWKRRICQTERSICFDRLLAFYDSPIFRKVSAGSESLPLPIINICHFLVLLIRYLLYCFSSSIFPKWRRYLTQISFLDLAKDSIRRRLADRLSSPWSCIFKGHLQNPVDLHDSFIDVNEAAHENEPRPLCLAVTAM